MGFLANPVAVWITFIFGIFCIIAALLFLRSRSFKLGSAIFGVLAILLGIGWFYGTTHRVVPPNQRWLIINTATGKIEGATRTSGITRKPFVLYQINAYPGAIQQPFCLDYTPALQEGYEIFVHICGVYDASKLDWAVQFTEHNFVNEEQMLSYWTDQTKENVSSSLKDVNYTQIVTDRASVSAKIRENLLPWFSDINVSVSNIQLSNWDFTNADIKTYVNQASAASMKATVEKQLLEAAKIARERQLYEVETANLVLLERGKGLQTLFESLEITDDSSKAYLASQMTWYTYAQNPPTGTQIILGIGGNPIAVPIQSSQQPATNP
jgi:hypothetical protein